MIDKRVIYNREPVHYCKHCLSLKVLRMSKGSDECYCDACGSTDIETTDIFTWKARYRARYKKDF